MNDLARQGAALYKEHKEAQARDLFVQALRQDWQDAEAWLWLAATFRARAEIWRCLTIAARLRPEEQTAQIALKYFAPSIARRLKDEHNAAAPVEVNVNGTRYTASEARLHTLRLGDQLWLRREPHNRFDTNAIRVEADDDRVAGYLPKEMAASLAPALDVEPQLVPVRVIELQGLYPNYRMLTLRVMFTVPQSWLPNRQADQWEYAIEDGPKYLRILLNCPQRLLEQVEDVLHHRGLVVEDVSISPRTGPDGRHYPWYLRLRTEDRQQAVAQIEDCFERDLGNVPAAVKLKRAEARQADLQAELNAAEQDRHKLTVDGLSFLDQSQSLARTLQEKDNELAAIEHRLQQNQDELNHLRRQARMAAKPQPAPELAEVLRILLPNVEFMRDSLEILTTEAQNREPTLQLLQQVCYDPAAVRAKRVESVPDFLERHVSGDGRLYFRRGPGSRIEVLVSNKDSQPRDLRYLRNVA